MSDQSHQVLTELLILRAQAGREDAIGLIVLAWQDRLTRHASRLTGKVDAGLDVMQEAWLDIARGIHRLEDPAKFGPWAYTIVSRHCALWIHREQRRRQLEQHSAAEKEVAASATEAMDDSESIRIALRNLPSDQRAILELRYVEEYGIAQIAEALGIPPGTVKSRLFRAREQLREIITKVTR